MECVFVFPLVFLQAHKFLQPPAPYKQFLISPPCSPPAGWEPREEGLLHFNHILLVLQTKKNLKFMLIFFHI